MSCRARGRKGLVAPQAWVIPAITLVACGGQRDAADPGPRAPVLALVSDRGGGDLDVYLHALGSSRFDPLAPASGVDYGPSWSPDGSAIVVDRIAGENAELFLVPVDGAAPVNLTNHEAYDGGAAFSPDGSEIVFTTDREPHVAGHSGRDIWIMDADGANPRRLTRNDMYEGAPRFSPDGARIAFCRQLPPETAGGDSNGDVFVMNRDGSDVRRLTTAPTFDCLADWSPDGRTLAYHGCGAEGCRIFLVSVDGGPPVEVPTSHPANWPRWSPDGAWIAYTASHDDQTDVWIVRPDGSDSRQVTTHPGRDEVAAWEPASR